VDIGLNLVDGKRGSTYIRMYFEQHYNFRIELIRAAVVFLGKICISALVFGDGMCTKK